METGPHLAMESWFGSERARVDRRPRQLYVSIKPDLSKSTFFLVPSKQADTIIICTPQGEKGTIFF